MKRSHQRIRAALKAKGYTARAIRYQRPRFGGDMDNGGWWVSLDPLPGNGESPIVCFTLPEVLREIVALPNAEFGQCGANSIPWDDGGDPGVHDSDV